ncbi:cuticle protein 16.8-like [Ixodes scapularis]
MKLQVSTLIVALLPIVVRTAPTLLNGVVTNRFRNDDGQGNYQFGYDWTHPGGEGVFQRESGDSAGRKQGSYGLKDADGRVRVVSYIADENGFRVSVSTNEPGTRPSAPADVRFQLPDAQLTSTAFQSPAPTFQNQAPTFPSQAPTFQNRAPTFQRRAPLERVNLARSLEPAPVLYSQPTGVLPPYVRRVVFQPSNLRKS